MINIGICDDSDYWISDIRRKIEAILDEIRIDCNIIEFSSGEEVLKYDGETMHLLFLDVEMDGISGLDVMEKIRKDSLFGRIVFVTSYEQYRYDAIDFKTLAFVQKPVKEEELSACIRAAIREDSYNKSISVNTLNGSSVFRADDIIYIKAKRNCTLFHLKDEEVEGYIGLKDVEKLLIDSSIIRVHKSYLVNLLYVEEVNWGVIKLISDEELPIGRFFYQNVRDSFFYFIKRMTIDRMA